MPNMTISSSGNKEWRNKNNNLHREDGPAVEYSSGTKVWYFNGKRHRFTGPALVWDNGYVQWWLNDEKINPENHPFCIFRNDYDLSEEYEKWPKDMKALFKLTYG